MNKDKQLYEIARQWAGKYVNGDVPPSFQWLVDYIEMTTRRGVYRKGHARCQSCGGVWEKDTCIECGNTR